jgi:two-component system NtrC family response regulator
MQRGQILCKDHEIRPEDLPVAIHQGRSGEREHLLELQKRLHLPPEGMDLPGYLADIERKLVHEALERSQGNQVRAAALLGITRDQLRYRVKQL